jgi:hypothetical protein
VRRAAGALLGTTGAISVLTAINRLDMLPTRMLASSPSSVESGRIWLLCTSAFLADRPALASLAGFAVVGLAVAGLCGVRVLWLAAVTGHVGSAGLVYATIFLVRAVDPTAFHAVFAYLDYGTSAVIAAWIGALACWLWQRDARLAAVALCVGSGLIGYLLNKNLTALDTEHVLALAFGVLAMRFGPALARPRLARPPRVPAEAELAG